MSYSEYWEPRLIENQYEHGTNDMLSAIRKYYKDALNDLDRFIGEIWLDAQSAGGMSRTQLYQMGRYYKIYQQINDVLSEMFTNEDTKMTETLVKLYNNTYHSAANKLGVELRLMNNRTAEFVVNANFKGARFSDRIWKHQDKLKSKLMQSITQTATLGRDFKAVSRELAKGFNVSYRAAKQLVSTETSRVLNAACLNAAIDRGYATYTLLQETDACDECLEYAGEHIPLTEQVIPVHPNCKCAAIIDIN